MSEWQREKGLALSPSFFKPLPSPTTLFHIIHLPSQTKLKMNNMADLPSSTHYKYILIAQNCHSVSNQTSLREEILLYYQATSALHRDRDSCAAATETTHVNTKTNNCDYNTSLTIDSIYIHDMTIHAGLYEERQLFWHLSRQ